MSSINDVRLVGILANDAEIRTLRDNRKRAVLMLQTFKFWRDRATGESRSTTITHTIACYKQAAMPMLEQFAKKGRCVKVLGELSYDGNGRAEVVVSEGAGEVGMMNFAQVENSAPAPAESAEPPQQAAPRVPPRGPSGPPSSPSSAASRSAGGMGKLGGTRARPQDDDGGAAFSEPTTRQPNNIPDDLDAEIPF